MPAVSSIRMLLAAFTVGFATRAHALCVQWSVAETVERAEAVIEAKVDDIRAYSTAGWEEIRLSTQKVWKKSEVETSTVRSFKSPERPPFVVGKSYLMFLEKPIDGILSIGKCSPRTRELSLAEEDRRELQKLTAPLE